MVQDFKTRGTCLKIGKHQARTNLKHNTFTLRVINAWNSLTPQLCGNSPIDELSRKIESELCNYYTSKLYTSHIKPIYEERSLTEGFGHRGQ